MVGGRGVTRCKYCYETPILDGQGVTLNIVNLVVVWRVW